MSDERRKEFSIQTFRSRPQHILKASSMTTQQPRRTTHHSILTAAAAATALLWLLIFTGCASAPAELAKPAMPWEDPTYTTDSPATQAVSRPEPGEGGWTLWMKHHEDRSRWVAEKKVDLLMVGDSIIFTWSRVGKPVWDEYYANRSAVNIGSSGDKTQHMLWHFLHGGLDGMKDHNPKLVVVMIGTNNRGEPDKHGADTAYGILALLKEIHAKLPKSKILLLAIFPRGDKPEDAGRLRNDEINKIIKTYTDNKTVYWLDIEQTFLDKQGKLNRDLMPDALHPNEKGFRAWAQAMDPTIKKLMGE